jgi:hypothetical protein
MSFFELEVVVAVAVCFWVDGSVVVAGVALRAPAASVEDFDESLLAAAGAGGLEDAREAAEACFLSLLFVDGPETNSTTHVCLAGG